MSGVIFDRQNAWEETPTEFETRLNKARSGKTGWTGTIVGLVIAFTALAALILA